MNNLRGSNPFSIVDGYDPVGNRLTRNLDGNPITWSYDDLYRLTGQQKAGQVCTYTLDGVGNLKTMWEGGNFPKTFTFNAVDRLVTMVEGASLTTYAWTGYGALESEITGSQTTGYAYNGQDQLAVVTDPSGDKTTYSFDGDGLRRSVATSDISQDPPTLALTTMVWDGSDYLLLSEPTQNRVVLTLGSEIVSCGSKDLLTDPLGSLVKEISTGASLGSLIEMYPYGSLVPGTGSPTIPFVYVGAFGYHKDGPKRSYVRARELYEELGRWMQLDPMWPWEPPFGVVHASPVSQVDPEGLWSIEPLPCKGIKGKLIKVEPGDISGVVGGPIKGKAPQLTGGSDCTKGFTDAQGRHCVCVNGSFFGWNEGGTGFPVGPYKDCSGVTIGGDSSGLTQIVTDHGYVYGFPSGHGNPSPTGRTGACVDKKGRIQFLIVIDDSNGVTIGDFVKCLKSLCKSPNKIVVLDGSGSSQIWVSDPPGKGQAIYPGDRRKVINWIVICEKKAAR